MKSRQELANDLNGVLQRNYDAINGYKDAARDVENDALKRYLIDQAAARVDIGEEIHREIVLLGAKPVTEGSTMGILHRTWMNFKTNLTHDNEKEVCEECIRGEKAVVEEYDNLLEEKELSPRLREKLLSHKAKTLQAIADLMLIRDAF
ncbi:MAG TPA: PA2169 family four-helix-bundle protein [Cyclobacteriaceae bacterium]|nr:PA2169 family four-helix-bundle protein [Cyclobacteriaceae bacterium]